MKFCTLASSSSGNCTFVTDGKTNILIDAGISMRRIVCALRALGSSPEKLCGILLTHEHTDHTNGLKMLSKYYHIPLFASHGTAAGICRYSPELKGLMHEFSAGDELSLGTLSAKSFPTPHDTPESVGYRITDGEKLLFFATDTGCLTDVLLTFSRGADAAVIEANHDIDLLKNGTYPPPLKRRILSDRGHMSNRVCGEFAKTLAEGGTKRIVLAHLSRENNTPELAYETVFSALNKAGVTPGDAVALSVAPKDCPGDLFEV